MGRLRSLWYVLAFTTVSHAIAFVQFAIKFPSLSLPSRWYGQFAALVIMSFMCAAVQFFLDPKGLGRWILVLIRGVLLLVATYPLGNYINVRVTLLSSLVFELMTFFPLSAGFITSIVSIASAMLVSENGLAWQSSVRAITIDNLLFMGFYPALIMATGAFLKKTRILAIERKSLVERLRRASSTLVETNLLLQEHVIRNEDQARLVERERISRELHDTIGYTLMNIIATMKASLELSTRDTQKMHDFMVRGIAQAQKGLEETRTALRAMRTTGKSSPSLVTLVDRLAKAFDDTDVHVSTHYSNLRRSYGEHADSVVYRIVQEGIANAIRHGDATEIVIHVSDDAGRIDVRVTDNGCGSEDTKEGIGLSGIRERLDGIDGDFLAGNIPGGFRLSAWLLPGKKVTA